MYANSRLPELHLLMILNLLVGYASVQPANTHGPRNGSESVRQRGMLSSKATFNSSPICGGRKLSLLIDRVYPLYDCMLMHYGDEQADVNYWLRQEKEKNHGVPAVVKGQKSFKKYMDALSSGGSLYDPRNDPLGRLLAMEEVAGRGQMAREAKRAWQQLHHVQEEIAGFDEILDGSAELKKKQYQIQSRKVSEALVLHCAHMAAREARRWAGLRWKKAQGLLMCMLWWTNRAVDSA